MKEIIILNESNLKMAKRRLATAKSTPKSLEYLFLPLTKKETIAAYETTINRYEQENKA